MTLNFNKKVLNIGGNLSAPPLQYYRKGFSLGGDNYTPTWQDVVLSGIGALTLVNAKADSLEYLKLFGGCEQSAENLATVTAEGKTVQTDGLPSDFQRVEYIQSTGTQYINTGFVIPDLTNKYKIHYRMTVDGGTQPSSSQNVKGYTGANGVLSIAYTRDSGLGSSGEGVPVVANHIYDITQIRYADASRSTVIDNTAITNSNQSTAYDDRPYCIFNLSPLDTNYFRIYGKIYEFQAYKNDLIQMNLLPCRRVSDSVLGMYDTVSGNFFTNEGTDTFIAGNDVTVPTPAIPIPLVCNNGTLKFRSKSGLPAGYIKLDYLQGGNGTYIDTGIIPTSNVLHVKWKGQLLGSTYGGSFYGCSTSTTPRAGFRLFSNANTGEFIIQSYSNLLEANGGFDVVDCDVTYDVTNLTINGRINNTTISETNANINTTFNKNMLLFGAYIGDTVGSSGEQKCWWLQVEKDGVLVQNLVPCMRAADSVLGMYDTVSGLLFTNVGTGSFTAGNIDYTDIEIYVDGTQETITDTFGNVASVENLLSVDSTYTDTQEVLTGAITRKVGIKILNGSETWIESSSSSAPFRLQVNDLAIEQGENDKVITLSTHFIGVSRSSTWSNYSNLVTTAINNNVKYFAFRYLNKTTTLEEFKQWLAEQYNVGTPVIVIYALATATTESVTGQALYREPLTVTGSLSDLVVNTTTATSTIPIPNAPIPIKCNNGVLKQRLKSSYDSNYNVLAGIRAVGSGAWFGTGINADIDTEIEVEASNITVTSTQLVVAKSPATTFFRIVKAGSSQKVVGSINSTSITSNIDGSTRFTAKLNKTGFYINGDLVGSIGATSTSGMGEIEVCHATYGSTSYLGSSTTFHRVTIRQNGTVVFNGVPRERISDGKIGLFDTVSNTLFTSAGAKEFESTGLDPNAYEVYADGTIETVGIHTSDSDNLCNEIMEAGSITSAGADTEASDVRIRLRDTMTLPVGTYTLSVASGYGVYISLGGSALYSSWASSRTFTVSGSAKNMRFAVRKGDGTAHISLTDNIQVMLNTGSTASTYEPYHDGNIATAENLLAVDTYKDIQEVLSGDITRKVGIYAITGQENWGYQGTNTNLFSCSTGIEAAYPSTSICTHYKGVISSTTTGNMQNNDFKYGYTKALDKIYIRDNAYDNDLAGFKAYLAEQFNAGNPVIIVYPLGTSTTESVTGQTMNVKAGTNVIEITQASIDNLELEAKYKAGVTVTVTEIENANLDNSVTVTIT